MQINIEATQIVSIGTSSAMIQFIPVSLVLSWPAHLNLSLFSRELSAMSDQVVVVDGLQMREFVGISIETSGIEDDPKERIYACDFNESVSMTWWHSKTT
jgi:hypothetical protein